MYFYVPDLLNYHPFGASSGVVILSCSRVVLGFYRTSFWRNLFTQDPTAPGGAEDDEFMMELAAARAAMEEQTARRKALRGEGSGEEEAGDASGDGGSGDGPGGGGAKAAAAAAGSYNKVCTRPGAQYFVFCAIFVKLLLSSLEWVVPLLGYGCRH